MLACKLPTMETTVSVEKTDTSTNLRVEVWPSMHIVTDSKKEPMVEYTLNSGVTFVLPERYIRHKPQSFLSLQLDALTNDIHVQRETDVTKIQLTDPVFQDTFVFALLLDYLKRSTEDRSVVTLRRADTELTNDEWRKLNELEQFVLHTTDRNPYWTGLTDASFTVDGRVHQAASMGDVFTVSITPGRLVVKGTGGFELHMLTSKINCTPLNRPKSLLEASVQQMTGTKYPFPVDFVRSFFIPHNHILCKIEGDIVRCEGVVHSDGSMRIEPVDNINDYMWFYFALSRRFAFRLQDYKVVYGVSEPMDEETDDDDVVEDQV